MIEIEKNVPAPDDGPNARRKYPFREMDVGDSFFVKDVSAGNVGNAAANWGRNNGGCKFATRSVDGGARVWRIS